MISIIDCGMGNVGSIANMLKKIGVHSAVTSDLEDIQASEKLILPGIGAFDQGMQSLTSRGLIEVLNRKVVEQKTPVLGICLGAQLITRGSEEGRLPGLGWIAADTVRFSRAAGNGNLKIPHMGWNYVDPASDDALLRDLPPQPRFYFVHSYHLRCDRDSDVIGWTEYRYRFASVVRHENICGMQFHPEKSHKFGLQLLRNFVERV
jgi:imidazole glycerol-phosphate synthase subunit HisH